MTHFSLLLCTYAKDSPGQLCQCLESIYAQSVQPDELIIVKDGPLTGPLERVLSDISFPQDKIVTVALANNSSLGIARAAGLKAAKYDWVALMDSDDICVPTRFEKQLSLIHMDSSLSIVGGQIAEFDDLPERTTQYRHVPTSHNDILAYAKKRNPFNAMTVMFKRRLALEAGNFRYFPGFEDYDLWVRMIKHGARCANHPDVLVHARIGNGLYARRKGMWYIRSELRMQKQLKKLELISSLEFLRNLLIRIPIRLFPTRALEFVYKQFARLKRDETCDENSGIPSRSR